MSTPPSPSPVRQIYRLHETIRDGGFEYGCDVYFTASGPAEVTSYVHHHLETVEVTDSETWSESTQEAWLDSCEPGREIRVTVSPVTDIFTCLGIEDARTSYTGGVPPQSIWLILEALYDYKRHWYNRNAESQDHPPTTSLDALVDEPLKAEKAILELRMLYGLTLDQFTDLPF